MDTMKPTQLSADSVQAVVLDALLWLTALPAKVAIISATTAVQVCALRDSFRTLQPWLAIAVPLTATLAVVLETVWPAIKLLTSEFWAATDAYQWMDTMKVISLYVSNAPKVVNLAYLRKFV